MPMGWPELPVFRAQILDTMSVATIDRSTPRPMAVMLMPKASAPSTDSLRSKVIALPDVKKFPWPIETPLTR